MRAEELPSVLPNLTFLVPAVRRDPDDPVTENSGGLNVSFRRIVRVPMSCRLSRQGYLLLQPATCDVVYGQPRQLVIADDDVPAVERNGSRCVADPFELDDIV